MPAIARRAARAAFGLRRRGQVAAARCATTWRPRAARPHGGRARMPARQVEPGLLVLAVPFGAAAGGKRSRRPSPPPSRKMPAFLPAGTTSHGRRDATSSLRLTRRPRPGCASSTRAVSPGAARPSARYPAPSRPRRCEGGPHERQGCRNECRKRARARPRFPHDLGAKRQRTPATPERPEARPASRSVALVGGLVAGGAAGAAAVAAFVLLGVKAVLSMERRR